MAVNCYIKYEKGEVSSKNLAKFLKNLEKHNTTVGIHKEDGAKVVGKDGFTLIKNACIQEFGNTQTVQETRRFKSPSTGKWFYLKKGTEIEIPKRPFVRIFNRKSEKDILTETFKYYVVKGEKTGDWREVYDKIGQLVELRMKERIAGQEIKPENAEMTKEYKGSSTPLIQHGDLYYAIKHEVH